MPGLAMDLTPTQPVIKDEEIDDDIVEDVEGEGDADDGGYRPRPGLSKPNPLMRSMAYLIRGMDSGLIDVEPEYQREVVWTSDRMTGLIDSLMENYYIPPIILNRKPRPEYNGTGPKSTMVCVDGKQRLSSIQCFIKGLIPCHDHRGATWWFCNPSSRGNRNILPPPVQTAFLAKEIASFEFHDLSREQEEDLFSRVQKGVQLTPAEKMRAATGPWQELGKAFVEDFPNVFGLLKERARGKDFQQALACFSQVVEVRHPSAANGVPTLRTNVAHLARFVRNGAALDEATRSDLVAVFQRFERLVGIEPDIFRNVERRLKGVQTFAPLELVAVAVLISMYGDSRNDRLLLGDIKYLRDLLREHFVDLRMNLPTWKFVWDYIENLEQVRGAVDGSTIDPSRRRQGGAAAGTADEEMQAPVRRARSVVEDSLPPFPTAETVRSPKRARESQASMAKRPSEPNVTQVQKKRPRIQDHPLIKPGPEPETIMEEPALPAELPFRSTPVSIPRPHPYGTRTAVAAPPITAAPAVSDPPAVPVAPMMPNSMPTQSRPLFTPATAPSGHPSPAAWAVRKLQIQQQQQQQQQSPAVKSTPAQPTPTNPNPNTNPNPTAASWNPVNPPAEQPPAPTAPFRPPTHLTHQRLARRTPQPVQPLRVARRTPQVPLTTAQKPLARSTRTSPTTPVTPAAPSARTTQSPSIEQLDGVIDLTSDTEAERQDLLSSFRGRATGERATGRTGRTGGVGG